MACDVKIKVAGKVFRFSCVYDYIKKYCDGWLTDEPEEISLEINDRDIVYERTKSEKICVEEEQKILISSKPYLETLAVYRKIADSMLDYDTLLYHGSVIAVDGVAYLFTAKSGTGKSTHTRLWREHFGDRAVMVNDDKPLLKVSNEGVIAYGTPWNGKHRLGDNISAPLKAICILERDNHNHIEKVTKKDAYNMLVQQIYRSTNPQKLIKALELVDKLADRVELYRLGCNMEKEAAVTAYQGMCNEEK